MRREKYFAERAHETRINLIRILNKIENYVKKNYKTRTNLVQTPNKSYCSNPGHKRRMRLFKTLTMHTRPSVYSRWEEACVTLITILMNK